MEPERRSYQRLHLTKPIDGRFGRRIVRVVDVSAIGALIECDQKIRRSTRAILRFSWREQTVKIKAVTVRGDDDQYGLNFTEDSELLRQLIAESAAEVLRAQEANLGGDRALNVVGDETLTAASAGLKHGKVFVVYMLEDGAWVRRKSLLPDQPPNGFTVSAAEPQEQVEMLCRTFEGGDEEAKRMTRLLAELSVAAVRH